MAINEANSVVTMNLTEKFKNTGDINIASIVAGKTDSELKTGGGSLLSAKTSVSAAYGRTRSLVDVDFGNAPEESIGKLNITNNGYDDVNADVTDSGFAAIKVSGTVGAAYSQDVFSTVVKLAKGTYNTGSVKIMTDFENNANTSVAPSGGGINVSLAGLGLSLATARNTADIITKLDLKDADLKTGKNDITIQSNGSARSNAEITSPKVSVSGVSIASHYGNADLSARQGTIVNIENGGLYGNNIKVNGFYNNVSATSTVGGLGKDGGTSYKVELAGANINNSYARENAEATVSLTGTHPDTSTIVAKNLDVTARTPPSLLSWTE